MAWTIDRWTEIFHSFTFTFIIDGINEDDVNVRVMEISYFMMSTIRGVEKEFYDIKCELLQLIFSYFE